RGDSDDDEEQQLDVDQEVKYWEDKLGINGENSEKVKQEFIKDGWDEDFFTSLDAIDDAVKERKKDLAGEQEGPQEDGEDAEDDEEESEDSADEEVDYWEHKLGIDSREYWGARELRDIV
ncbi:hypothetical protein FOZ62_024415, partial [Perkinsus olseni]